MAEGQNSGSVEHAFDRREGGHGVSTPTFDPAGDSFDEIYQRVGGDLQRVPWASLAPRVELVAWLDGTSAPPSAPRAAALVVACGLGDDAEELARRGFAVVAFDVSPTAIELCRRRFPASNVAYGVEDLLALPPAWHRMFDLVVEVNTVQSLVPGQHGDGVAAIAETVAAGGALFVCCSGRDESDLADHRPWPLTRRELAGFHDAGLVGTSFADTVTASGTRQFVATYARPG